MRRNLSIALVVKMAGASSQLDYLAIDRLPADRRLRVPSEQLHMSAAYPSRRPRADHASALTCLFAFLLIFCVSGGLPRITQDKSPARPRPLKSV
jgi:hypothetical protein